MQKEGDEIHHELKTELHAIHSKVDHLQGSFDAFKEILKIK